MIKYFVLHALKYSIVEYLVTLSFGLIILNAGVYAFI